MTRALPGKLAALLLSSAVVAACGGAPADAPQSDDLSAASASRQLLSWNQIALDAIWLDSTPPAPGQNRVAGEQGGPTRASRALAIVHLAIYDAVQSIAGDFQTYTEMPLNGHASMSAAIAVAAHDTLAPLFPSQAPQFDQALAADLKAITSSTKDAGVKRGALAAANILARRRNDGSQVAEPDYVDMNLPVGPGQWAPDTISKNPVALGGYWMNVTPFALQSADQFRAPPPHALDSPEYQADFVDVYQYGGDGETTPTLRTADQTVIGIYWGYDGAPRIGTPPRLYNLIAVEIAHEQGYDHRPSELSRILAMVNTAMADAGISAWDSKYFYNLWRPSNAIRATPGSNPDWMALGAMESNSTSPDFTPPFPAYPSGHATFGGALFQILRHAVRDEPFTFVSDEFNGVTTDHNGNVRPRLPRRFADFGKAEAENARSRIYLGVHWQEDADAGIAMGNSIADYVASHYFRRR